MTKVAEGGGTFDFGDTITYNVTVCNIGNQTVTDVTVTDPLLGLINFPLGTLAPDACDSTEFTYTPTMNDTCRGWINNTVYVYSGVTFYTATSKNVTVNCPEVPRDVDLFFLIDGSASMTPEDFALQLDGVARGIMNASIVPRDGGIAVSVIQFGTTARLEVPLTPVTNETVDQLNASIRAIQFMDAWTNMVAAFDLATAYLTQYQSCCPQSSKSQVIDLSTDGKPVTSAPGGVYYYEYTETMAARNASLAAGFDVVNTLGVGTDINESFLQNLTWPGNYTDLPGFYLYAENFAVFTESMEQKIITELQKASIGDFVWDDCSVLGYYDGIQQSNETGVPTVNVALYNVTKSLITTTTTNGTGYYSFTNLAPGVYYLRFERPELYSGWTLKDRGGDDAKDSDVNATGWTGPITLTAGETNLTCDAGLWTEPCPPIPEMDTVVLFSAGLLTLAGYLVVRRRKIRG